MEKTFKIFSIILVITIFVTNFLVWKKFNESEKELDELENQIKILKENNEHNWNFFLDYFEKNVKINTNKISDIQKELTETQKKLNETNEGLDRLDKTTHKIKVGSPKPSIKWLEIDNWRRITHKQTEYTVKSILGNPTRVTSDSLGKQYYYSGVYNGKSFSGYIRFTWEFNFPEKKNLIVDTWTEPMF